MDIAIKFLTLYMFIITGFILLFLNRTVKYTLGNKLAFSEDDYEQRARVDFIATNCSKGNNKNKRSKIYLGENGYYQFIDSDIYVHRWVMEKHLGKKLSSHEVVHHKDRNKLNNSIENLQIMYRWEHDEIHKPYLISIGVLVKSR
jgi:hypothetical protein